MNNTVLVGKELEDLNAQLLKKVESFLLSVENKQFSLVTNAGLYKLGWIDSFRLFLEQNIDNSSPVRKMVLSSAYYINKTCPWALPLYFNEFLGRPIKMYEVFRPSSSELIQGLSRVDDDFISSNRDKLYKAMQKAGAVGSVSIKESHEDDLFYETHVGFKTLCSLNHFFHGAVGDREIKNSKIVVVDGAIIDVSEIHHLLEYSYDTKKGVALIARSFSDDVSNTLRVNWDSGKTKVIPFTLPDSTDTLNECKDICTVCNVMPVSSDTGMRVSNIDFSDYPENDIFYNEKKDTLRILLSQVGVERCQKAKLSLQEKYDKEKVEDIRKILSDRISRMSSRDTVIYTKLLNTGKGLIEDRAGSFFSYFSRCASQNVVRMDSSYFVDFLPASDAARAVRMAKSDRASFEKIRAVIKVDHGEC